MLVLSCRRAIVFQEVGLMSNTYANESGKMPRTSSSACNWVVKCVFLGGETAFYNVAVMSVRRRRGEERGDMKGRKKLI